MTKSLRPSRLPQVRANSVLVSGEYPHLLCALEQMRITPFATEPDCRLPAQIAWHPDMQASVLGSKLFVLQGGPLRKKLCQQNLECFETLQIPGDRYPTDAICNVLSWGQFVLGNPCTADGTILQEAKDAGFKWIPVKQGYTACSTAMVDKYAAITADPGVAAQLEKYGVEVLHIAPGHIALPGYQTGFFGGCCGKIAPDIMVFVGRLESHPDGKQIRDFLQIHGITAVELFDHGLLDVGGILSLF